MAAAGTFAGFSPDGAVAAAQEGSNTRLFNTRTGAQVVAAAGTFAGFSPDGAVAAAQEGSNTRLFNTRTGAQVVAAAGTFVGFSPDGAVAAAQEGSNTRLFNTQTGAQVVAATGTFAGFSLDGAAAAAQQGSNTRLFNTQTGAQVVAAAGNFVRFSFDRISSKSSLKVLMPNGGELWAVGSVKNITWDTGGTVARVSLEYSTDDGNSWRAIATNITNSGPRAWTIPNTPSTSCLVRVFEASTRKPVDKSDGLFTITLAPDYPTNLRLAARSETSLWIFWKDNSTNETGFSFEMKVGAATTWTDIGAIPDANITSGYVEDLAPSTKYSIRMRAYNARGYSAYSNVASATTPPPWNTCFPSGLLLGPFTFTPGTYAFSSEKFIQTEGDVVLQSKADVSLRAPYLSLKPGFSVASGAVLRVLPQAVICPMSANQSIAEDTARVASNPRLEVSDSMIVPLPPLPINHLDLLPPWVQEILLLKGVDFTLMDHALFDANGQWLVFETTQGIHPADGNSTSDIYRIDLLTEDLALLSHAPAGQAGNGPSRYPAANASGDWVLFQSDANDLVTDDNNGVTDIFLRDVPYSQTRLITPLTTEASAHPAIDSYGEDVLYDQYNGQGQRQIWLDNLWRDGQVDNLSLTDEMDEMGLALDNHHPAISPDGRFVTYLEVSYCEDEVTCQVYFLDRDSGQFQRQACPDGLVASKEGARPYFNADGSQVEWYLPDQQLPLKLDNPLSEIPNGGKNLKILD